MLSTYPDLFTAAMACAGNPKGCSAEKVAQTPVYAVMGSADKIMRPEEVNLQTFLDAVGAGGGEYRFDTEAGWDHEKTCKESYTAERLDWVFSHK
jgi:predicted esterase